MSDERRHEITRGLDEVRERISTAAAAGGRDPSEVTVVVITKTWPVSDLEILLELGVRDLGENKHQDAEEKAAGLSGRGVRWHFVGQIQSNKAGKIAAYADVVHSVDSIRVAQRLNSGAHQHGRSVTCLVQVNLDDAAEHEGRGGVRGDEVAKVAHAIETAGRLELGGVMGVAPLHGDADGAYQRLMEVSGQLRARYPRAVLVSAGMSGDLEAAVRRGATHVRVGSAVLGERRLNE